jgi:hypothetical protein
VIHIVFAGLVIIVAAGAIHNGKALQNCNYAVATIAASQQATSAAAACLAALQWPDRNLLDPSAGSGARAGAQRGKSPS